MSSELATCDLISLQNNQFQIYTSISYWRNGGGPLVSYDRVYYKMCNALNMTYSQVYKVVNKSVSSSDVSKFKPGGKQKLDIVDK